MFLVIDWAGIGIKTLQFILSFSILVTLHEMGHFFTARWFKCRVEKFYLFFNPWFSLWKKQVGETEYGLGWVPFGGYVKISGMVDESMDKEQMKLPPQPYEFRSKPAWQRLIIMLGGVTVNVLLAFFIYAMMLWQWGESFIPTNKMTYGVAADSLAQSIGLKNGDKILSVDGNYIDRFSKIPLQVILSDAKTFEVDRNGEKIIIPIPEDFGGKLISSRDLGFISLRMPFNNIGEVSDTSVAKKAGLQKGDKILTINNTPTPFFDEFKKIISANKGKNVALFYLRNNDTLQTNLVVPVTGMIGIANDVPETMFEKTNLEYGFFESFPAGIVKGLETMKSYWLQLKLMVSGKVNPNESVGSVISIGNMFSSVWDWSQFWGLTAFFSMALAIMNLLPIPGLDGGHALFTIIEMVSGRKPSDKFMEYAQMVGMVLLLSLMVYALGLDVWRIFK